MTILAQTSSAVKKPRVPHIHLDRDGNAQYRTRLMTRDSAIRFCRCLQANERFLRAEAVRSDRANGERSWFVQYIPARQQRRDHMQFALQQARVLRSEAEGDAYQFYADDQLRGGAVWCLSVSGEVWETSRGQCSCPDYTVRCRKAGIVCKHVLTLRRRWAEVISQAVEAAA